MKYIVKRYVSPFTIQPLHQKHMQLVINGNLRTLISKALFPLISQLRWIFVRNVLNLVYGSYWIIIVYQFKEKWHKQRMKRTDAKVINHTFEAFKLENFVVDHYEPWTINIHMLILILTFVKYFFFSNPTKQHRSKSHFG